MQNGVENERIAIRYFRNVYGACVFLPATHLEAGVVVSQSTPVAGVLELGRYPFGIDATVVSICKDLEIAGFRARPELEVMRWKYSKLIDNVANAVDAALGDVAGAQAMVDRARTEAIACLRAASIDVATVEESARRRAELSPMLPVDGDVRLGSSTWQSLARRAGGIESDWLNGEIVLLGRLHGVATPVNEALQAIANQMCRDGVAPGSVTLEALTSVVSSFE
jgi:2-dehydropantoate 2-reductase